MTGGRRDYYTFGGQKPIRERRKEQCKFGLTTEAIGHGEVRCMCAMFGDLGVLRDSMQISKEITDFTCKKICNDLRAKSRL